MRLALTETQRTELEAAAGAEKEVRRWRRYQAVLLLADGQPPAAVAQTLRCSRASVYHWAAAWRQHGAAGLREGDHGGGKVKLDATAEAVLATLAGARIRKRVATAPRAGRCRCCARSWPAAGYAVSPKTVRRALHRLGYRWKRPHYVLGRPDPAYAEKRGP